MKTLTIDQAFQVIVNGVNELNQKMDALINFLKDYIASNKESLSALNDLSLLINAECVGNTAPEESPAE